MRLIDSDELLQTVSIYKGDKMSDLISRQAALQSMDTWDKFGCDPDGKLVRYDDDTHYIPYVHYEDMVDAIKNLPSVQPQRWIPVSEALPNDGVEVWVTIKGHDVIRREEGETLEQAIDRINKIRWVTRGYWSDKEHAWNDPLFGCPLMVKPIAWMPINRPEPYEPQKSEVKNEFSTTGRCGADMRGTE